MTLQRLLAFMMLLVQAAALAYLSRTIVFPATVVAVALAALLSHYRVTLAAAPARRLAIALAVVLLIKWRVAPLAIRFDESFFAFPYPLAHVIAQFFLIMQVAELFLHRGNDRLPTVLPLYGVGAMICAVDKQVSAAERSACLLLAVGFVVLAGLFFWETQPIRRTAGSKGRLRRRLYAGGIMGLVAAGAWLFGFGLYRYQQGLDFLIARLLALGQKSTEQTIGFSRNGKLTDITARRFANSDELALRVYADDAPGYLRALAFDELRGSDWHIGAQYRTIKPGDPPPGVAMGAARENYFPLRPRDDAPLVVHEVWPESSLQGAMFLSLNTLGVRAAVDSVLANEDVVVEADGLPAGHPYSGLVQGGAAPSRLSDADRRRLTALPEKLHPRVRALKEQVFAGCVTDDEKISAVERFFAANFEYQIGIRVPQSRDRLEYFLLEQRAAHCEYFATGAAVLLRLGGVPCRYVTGFVCAERNPIAGYWVARNKDAHAWVEAHDAASGWRIVETTPEAGVPAPAQPASHAQLWDYLRDQWRMFQIMLQRDGLRAFGGAMLALLRSRIGIALLALLAVYLVLRMRGRTKPAAQPPVDPRLAKLQHLLLTIDRQLAKFGLIRQSSETLHQFADRMQRDPPLDQPWRSAVAGWCRRYAELRYQPPERIDVATVAKLPQIGGETLTK